MNPEKLSIFASALFLSVQPALFAAPLPEYAVTDLSVRVVNPPRGSVDLNSSGTVTIHSQFGESTYLYQRGSMQHLQWPGVFGLYAFALNDAGDLAGRAHIEGKFGQRSVVVRNGVVVDISDSFGFETSSQAHGINAAGHVVGRAGVPGIPNVSHAYLFKDGTFIDLVTTTELANYPEFNQDSGAFRINDQGLIAGTMLKAGIISTFTRQGQQPTEAKAFLLNGSQATILPTLGGVATHAHGLNNSGVVCGISLNAAQQPRPYIYSNGVITDLAVGAETGAAVDINSHGVVVGHYTVPGEQISRGFIYENGVRRDLNSLIDQPGRFHIASGQAVNDQGQIAATAWEDDRFYPVILNPVTAKLVGFELVQSVQNWKGEVPLIENKPTLARLHVEPVKGQWPRVEATLRAFDRFRTELPGSPLRAINPGGELYPRSSAALWRDDLSSSLNFQLPPAWLTNEIWLEAHWIDSGVICAESAGQGGQGGDCSWSAVFRPAPPLAVQLVAITHTDSNGIVQAPTVQQALEIDARLRAAFPISRTELTTGTLLWPGQGTPSLSRINLVLRWNRWLDGCMGSCPRLDYGYLNNLAGSLRGLAAGIPADVSSGNFPLAPADRSRHTHAHEIGHCLGRHHAKHSALGPYIDKEGISHPDLATGACGEAASPDAPDFPMYKWGSNALFPTLGPMDSGEELKVFGYDHHWRTVVTPDVTLDLMSYCGSWRWPSRYTYTNLLEAITSRFASSPPPPQLLAAPRDFITVAGEIDLETDTAVVLPLHTITSIEAPPLPEPGPYLARLLDAAGGIISEISFQPQTGVSELDEEEPASGLFLLAFPFDPLAREVRIVRAAETLASVSASANVPSVTVTAPNGRAAFDGTISWAASDADNDELTALVQFSPDHGATWETIAFNVPGESAVLRADSLRGTSSGLIRVRVSDGFHSAMDESDNPFTVANHPPTLVQTAPENGSLCDQFQTVLFRVTAWDAEDGPLQGDSVRWLSDRDGELGSGPEFALDARHLSLGAHQIKAEARDSLGLTAESAVQILVVHSAPPRMLVRISDETMEISWFDPSGVYLLQDADALDQDPWTPVATPPQVSGHQRMVRVPRVEQRQFYRLTIP